MAYSYLVRQKKDQKDKTYKKYSDRRFDVVGYFTRHVRSVDVIGKDWPAHPVPAI